MNTLKKATTCRACRNPNAAFLMSGEIFNNSIAYYECSNCLYVQTEEPHWLTKAYSNAINSSDTGILRRNKSNSGIVAATLSLLGGMKNKVVDCAGGYGILVRLLRDSGIDASWSDPYCENLLAKGFEYQNGTAALVTTFEAFEHFVDPLDELEKLLKIAPNVLLSTEIISSPPPQQKDWWYYGREHGQHIGFFRVHTLEVMANKFGKKVVSDGKSYHLITDRNISKVRWITIILLAKILPIVFTWKLKSKTWDDHYKIAGNDQ